MRLKNILITVTDMERSKRFYKELFGLDVILDNGGNVILTEGLVLQDRTLWEQTTGLQTVPHNNAMELFFEERDMEGFAQRLDQYDARRKAEAVTSGTDYAPIQYVNRLMENGWGKKIIRFYDPDGNLIEVGALL